MKIEILFFKKEGVATIKNIKEMLDNTNSISFDENYLYHEGSRFLYSFKTSRKDQYISLSLSLKGYRKPVAEAFSNLKKIIRSGPHREKYRIAISYDESSGYFNEKLYTFIAKNEIKLRQFIYLVLLDSFGNDWVTETFEKSLENELKSRQFNPSDFVEKGLEGFTYGNYIDFLFGERRISFNDETADKLIQEINNKDEMDKASIIKTLKSMKTYTLWDKLFYKIDYPNAKDELIDISKIRNNIMHNKEISIEEFDARKKKLQHSNKNLNKAIEYVKSSNREEIEYREVVKSFSSSLMDIQNSNIGQYKKLAEDLSNLIKINIPKPIINPCALATKQVYKDQLEISGITKLAEELNRSLVQNGVSDSIKYLTEFYKNTLSNPGTQNAIKQMNHLSKSMNNLNFGLPNNIDLDND